MPAINHTAFPEKVEQGDKCCTIRALRKRPFMAGDTLHHFAGMRTTNCRRLMVVPMLESSLVKISTGGVWVNALPLSREEELLLAIEDGFHSLEEFYDYFLARTSSVFVGQIVRWCPRDASYWPAGGIA